MKKKSAQTIAITMGEPAGIGIEIILKALENPKYKHIKFIIIADRTLFPKTLAAHIKFHHVPFQGQIEAGICKTDYAAQILDTIRIGVDYCLNKQQNPHSDKGADGLVTAPINKDNIHAIEPKFFGHTDYIAAYIAEKTGQYHQPIMMLSCPELKAVPLTVHVPYHQVPQILTSDMIIKHVKIIHHNLQKHYKIPKPRIYLAGLNPHAGDNGIMGDEEIRILRPAVAALRAQNINISDPLSADTMFHAAMRKNYDVAVCMYHDQALIPVKTLGFDVGVNVTLGLPILRTSPDHGTALNIAGQNKANPSAMIAAIDEIITLSS